MEVTLFYSSCLQIHHKIPACIVFESLVSTVFNYFYIKQIKILRL